jgi:hypothetical protein
MTPNTLMNSTALTPTETSDAYDLFTDEGGGNFGKLLKFNKGRYTVNDNDVAIGSEYVALVHELRRGWVRFEDGRPVEYRLGLVRDGYQFLPRDSLGSTDERRWERDKKGKPKDPWQKQYYQPLIHLETDELVTFVTSSVGGEQAIRDLVRIYKPKKASSEAPIVSLQTDAYEHDQYGRVQIPVFKFEGWHDLGFVPSAPKPATAVPAPVATPAAASIVPPPVVTTKAIGRDEADNSDIDDDIPF